MDTSFIIKQSLECCQWSSQIEKDHNAVVDELRRMHFFDEDRENHKGRFMIIHGEVQTLLDDLRMWTALSVDSRKCSMITSFIDKIGWAWQEAESWIHYEVNAIKLPCSNVISSGYLHDYAERTKKSIHETFRFLFGQRFNSTTWHLECIENFSKLHDVITPKLSRLLQCDNIYHELIFYKRAMPYRQHQLTEIQSFTNSSLDTGNFTIPAILTNPENSDSFSQVVQLLRGELLDEDPLDMVVDPVDAPIPIPIPAPHAEQNMADQYPEPLTFQAFKKLALPSTAIADISLTKGHSGRLQSTEQSFGGDDGSSHARGWEAGAAKTPNGRGTGGAGGHEPKKRGPYKKRVVTCELTRKDTCTEMLSPIKIPKLRGSLLSPLN